MTETQERALRDLTAILEEWYSTDDDEAAVKAKTKHVPRYIIQRIFELKRLVDAGSNKETCPVSPQLPTFSFRARYEFSKAVRMHPLEAFFRRLFGGRR